MENFPKSTKLVKSGKMVGNGKFKNSFQNFIHYLFRIFKTKNNNKFLSKIFEQNYMELNLDLNLEIKFESEVIKLNLNLNLNLKMKVR